MGRWPCKPPAALTVARLELVRGLLTSQDLRDFYAYTVFIRSVQVMQTVSKSSVAIARRYEVVGV